MRYVLYHPKFEGMKRAFQTPSPLTDPWKRKEGSKRGMTANETQIQRANQQVRQVRQQARFEQAVQNAWQDWNDTIEVPDSPVLVPTTPPPPPSSTALIIRTPTTPRPRPRHMPSSPETSPELIRRPPVSTAPEALDLGKGKRRRNRTARLEEARDQGLLPESQDKQ